MLALNLSILFDGNILELIYGHLSGIPVSGGEGIVPHSRVIIVRDAGRIVITMLRLIHVTRASGKREPASCILPRLISGAGLLLCLAACSTSSDEPGNIGGIGTAEPPSGSSAEMSPAARRVSQIAVRDGDRDFLMVDKVHGKILVFQNGAPTFTGAALTGEYPVDALPDDAYGKTSAEEHGLKYKVTPAGRFTVSKGSDPAYGTTLDINEIQGKDWDIAIHRVWLGAPAEHRDARLRSPGYEDKHITYGCIDVDSPTMQQILRRVTDDNETPIYILPQDDKLITTLFESAGNARKASFSSE